MDDDTRNEILERLSAIEARLDRLEREARGGEPCPFRVEERRIIDRIVGLTSAQVAATLGDERRRARESGPARGGTGPYREDPWHGHGPHHGHHHGPHHHGHHGGPHGHGPHHGGPHHGGPHWHDGHPGSHGPPTGGPPGSWGGPPPPPPRPGPGWPHGDR